MPVSGVWMTSLGLLEQSSGSQLCTRELLCSQLQLLTWDWHTAQKSFDTCHVGDGYQFGTSADLSWLWDIGIKPVANILGSVLEFYLCPTCNSYCKLWTYHSCRFGGDFQGLCSWISLISLLWCLASRRHRWEHLGDLQSPPPPTASKNQVPQLEGLVLIKKWSDIEMVITLKILCYIYPLLQK